MAFKNIGSIKTIPTLFGKSFLDGQVGTYRGRKRPDNPEKEESAYLINEDFSNLNDWTETNSGTGANSSVSGGILTMTSGTTNNGFTKLIHSKNLGNGAELFPLTIEFRARGNYSAVEKQEWWIGLFKNDGNDPFAGAEDFEVAGYNPDEFGDDSVVSSDIAGSGSAGGLSNYVDNVWRNYKYIIYSERSHELYADETKIASDSTSVGYEMIPTTTDSYLIIKNITKGNPGVTQTLEIAYIRVYKG
jgi:hypothetical protein